MKRFSFLIVCLLLVFSKTLNAQQKIWTMENCISHAIENNITIKKAELNKNTSDLNYKQYQYNRLPSLAGTATGNFSNGAAIDPITSNFENQQILSNNFGVNGDVVLWQGGKLNQQIKQNKVLLQQSELYIKEAENNIALKVLEAYLQALYYYEGITIAENSLKSSAEELEQTRKKYDNGAIAKLNLSEIETQYSTNEYNLITAKNQYAQQVLALKQLLELEPSADFQIENISLDNVQIIIPDKQEVFNKAVQNLPDLKIYDLQKESLERGVKIARSGYYPTLSLGFGLNSGYTSTMNYEYPHQLQNNFKQQVSLSLNVPIFSKFQNRTNVRLAKIQLQQNDYDKIAASKTLYSKIETAYQNAVANQAQAASAEATRNNAKLSYDLARKKYELGGLTTTELAVSRNTYLNAEQINLQNKYLTVLYQQLLKFYQGESLTDINKK